MNIYPVLIAGGSGTRLWPVSRELLPKQLVSFYGKETLIQNTVSRLLPVFDPDRLRVVCGREHARGIARELEAMGISAEKKIIQEPCGRNTAPAILLSALEILKSETDAVLFVFPADHLIGDAPRFQEKIKQAASLALLDVIVTFGITPLHPETGYGYIEASQEPIGSGFSIKRFVEKPDLPTAQTYIQAGNFFWNSGMFAFKASVLCREFEKYHPNILEELSKMVSGKQDLNLENYARVENISIDFAIMERTQKAAVLPSDFRWSDIGSWKSLYDFMPKDADGNVLASGDIILQNTKSSFIMGEDRLIAVNHLENVVVVETSDAVFVSDLENSREVKSIVARLREKDRKEYQIHNTVREPWGRRRILENTDEITLKRLAIDPGSLIPERMLETGTRQWLVIQGIAKILVGSRSMTLGVGESGSVFDNSPHSIENTGKETLQVIEVDSRLKRQP